MCYCCFDDVVISFPNDSPAPESNWSCTQIGLSFFSSLLCWLLLSLEQSVCLLLLLLLLGNGTRCHVLHAGVCWFLFFVNMSFSTSTSVLVYAVVGSDRYCSCSRVWVWASAGIVSLSHNDSAARGQTQLRHRPAVPVPPAIPPSIPIDTSLLLLLLTEEKTMMMMFA